MQPADSFRGATWHDNNLAITAGGAVFQRSISSIVDYAKGACKLGSHLDTQSVGEARLECSRDTLTGCHSGARAAQRKTFATPSNPRDGTSSPRTLARIIAKSASCCLKRASIGIFMHKLARLNQLESCIAS